MVAFIVLTGLMAASALHQEQRLQELDQRVQEVR